MAVHAVFTKRISAQMVNPRWLCFAIFTFLGHPVIQDACQQFTLSSPPKGAYSCPGSNIIYTCVLSSSSAGAVTTVWKVSAFQCPDASNQLSLFQKSGGVLNPTAGGTCGNLSAVTTNISSDRTCYTSVLTIPALQALNGTNVTCLDGIGLAVVGNDTVIVKMTAIPGSFGTMTLNSTFVSVLTVTWTPPTTGGIPTGYNVSINDSSRSVVISDNGSSLYTHTFTGLMADTLYTVSVVAINCAGTSNVTSKTRLTVADPPNSDSIRSTFILYANNTLCLLNITWTPVGGSVTMYKVRVVAGDGTSVGQGSATCTTSPCFYVQQASVFTTKYTIFVASINGDGDVGPENISTISVINNITAVIYGAFTASFQCSFWDNQSYCLVCCSTDPSVSPDLSVYNISTSRGTKVTVDLDGLTSGQIYYCKAAATNNVSNSQNCTSPGFGDVNVFHSFRTASRPTASGTTSWIAPFPTVIIAATVVSILTSLLVVMVITIAIAIVCIRRKRTGGKTKRSTSQNLEMKQKECYVRNANELPVYGNDVMYDSLRTRSKQMNEANHTSTADEAKHMYSTPESKTKPHPSYYTVTSTGHTYGLLENPNDLFKKKVISMHMEEAYSQDTGQHIMMPITNDSYSLPLKQTSKQMGTGHNAVPPTQVAYEDVLSPANDGGYALPVDHKGIRLKTGSTYI